MNRTGRVWRFGVAMGVATALSLTGCGPAHSALTGESAQQILDQALAAVPSSPARFNVHIGVGVDTGGLSNVRPADVQSFGTFMQGISVDGTGSIENAQRVAVILHAPPLCPGPVYITTYDGTDYASGDGKTWTKLADGKGAGAALAGGFSITPAQLTSLTASAVDLKDVGAVQMDGQNVEHLHADVSAQSINTILGSMTPGNSAATAFLAQALKVRSAGIDIYVRSSDGRLDRIQAKATFDLDFSRLVESFAGGPSPGASGIPGGTLGFALKVEMQITDYASDITVTRPGVVTGGAAATAVPNCGEIGLPGGVPVPPRTPW